MCKITANAGRPRPTKPSPLLRSTIGWILRCYYRRIRVAGAEHVPTTGPVMLVANHPNGLVDGFLLCAFAPRASRILTKAPLCETPILGALLRRLGAIPVYRPRDEASRVVRNRTAIETAQMTLREGCAIGVFPEGVSHGEPELQPLQAGTARIALTRTNRGSGPVVFEPVVGGLKIVPLILDYSAPSRFRSSVTLRFGVPIAIDGDRAALTAAIQRALEAGLKHGSDRARARATKTPVRRRAPLTTLATLATLAPVFALIRIWAARLAATDSDLIATYRLLLGALLVPAYGLLRLAIALRFGGAGVLAMIGLVCLELIVLRYSGWESQDESVIKALNEHVEHRSDRQKTAIPRFRVHQRSTARSPARLVHATPFGRAHPRV